MRGNPSTSRPLGRTLRLQLRFFLPLILTLVVAAYAALPLSDGLTLKWFARDLNSRGQLIATTLSEAIGDALLADGTQRLESLFDRVAEDERLLAIGLCDARRQLIVASRRFPAQLGCTELGQRAHRDDATLALPPNLSEVASYAQVLPDLSVGELVLLHDLSFIEQRRDDARRYLIVFITTLGGVIAVIAAVVTQLNWLGWVRGVRVVLRGETDAKRGADWAALQPLALELRERLRDLEDEYRRAPGVEVEWGAERLRSLLRAQLGDDQIIVVSNREPFIHEHGSDGPVVKRPASGLVTAIEPVVRACGGTWIAHGSGSADREQVDRYDCVTVPGEEGAYTLRRIWLSEEEERGYYYGFANEGMWPLCHVAHVRPVFRESDWDCYRRINERFADAVAAQARQDDPLVLVQDYHFALLPAMIKARLPRATILTFWHIPWPNPESFGICPWSREILTGLLGSTILGFHTRFHCKNFLESVDRFLEARIEYEHSSISYQNDETLVESYPISIAWPTDAAVARRPAVALCRQRVGRRLGLPDGCQLVLGVDRFDYTKGILERLHAIERLLEKHPRLCGRLCFVQIAAPTRSSLEEYRSFRERIERLVTRINARFDGQGFQPVILLAQHHEAHEVTELYRAADVCVVTSLHDGMNLVCKEFVAARDDERGVLVLSRFAGAARELREALIVNPYHVEETADAIFRALTMPEAEQRERMASLRMTVREFNVFRWAGRMLADAGRWRMRQRIHDRVLKIREG